MHKVKYYYPDWPKKSVIMQLIYKNLRLLLIFNYNNINIKVLIYNNIILFGKKIPCYLIL